MSYKQAVTTASNKTASPGDIINATAAVTITLPTSQGYPAWQSPKPSNGWEVTVNNTSAGSVTVNTSDGTQIDGVSTATVAAGSRSCFTAYRGAWFRSV